jgi:tetratricopeptide (TPR) repeat protein
MKKIQPIIKEYAKTFGITLFAVFLVVCIVIYRISATTHERLDEVFIKKFAVELERAELEKLHFEELENPRDAMISLQIAAIHEHFEEFEEAAEHYARALKKAPTNPFVIYRVALFRVSQSEYNSAIYLIETLSDRPTPQIVNIKMNFYTALSDALEQRGLVPDAVKMSRLALRYARVAGPAKTAEARAHLAEKLSNLADWHIVNKDEDLAIVALKNSLNIQNDPATKYKLSLIYAKEHPYQAFRLMEEIFHSPDSQIVNAEIYHAIIRRLYTEAQEQGSRKLMNFFTHKERALKNAISQNYLFEDELEITNVEIVQKSSRLLKRPKFFLQFDVKNISDREMSSLYVLAEVTPPKRGEGHDLEQTLTFDRKIATVHWRLEPHTDVKHVVFEMDSKHFHKPALHAGTPAFAQVEVWGRKRKNFDWTPLYRGVASF